MSFSIGVWRGPANNPTANLTFLRAPSDRGTPYTVDASITVNQLIGELAANFFPAISDPSWFLANIRVIDPGYETSFRPERLDNARRVGDVLKAGDVVTLRESCTANVSSTVPFCDEDIFQSKNNMSSFISKDKY